MASSSDNPNGQSSADAPKINWQWGGEDMKIDDSARPPPEKLKGSRAYSIATPASDPSRRQNPKVNNPGSIPTAGGKALGVRAVEERERRKSQMSEDTRMPVLDKEGSPDPVTQNNTQSNTIPARMNDNGEASAAPVEEVRSESAPPPVVIESAAPPVVSDSAAPPVTEEAAPPPVEDESAVPPPAVTLTDAGANETDNVGELSSPAEKENDAPAQKERRGSRFLSKIGLGSKKDK